MSAEYILRIFLAYSYDYAPTSQLALDAYVARVTNPVRHVAKEVHNISHYPRPAVKYVGKSLISFSQMCDCCIPFTTVVRHHNLLPSEL